MGRETARCAVSRPERVIGSLAQDAGDHGDDRGEGGQAAADQDAQDLPAGGGEGGGGGGAEVAHEVSS